MDSEKAKLFEINIVCTRKRAKTMRTRKEIEDENRRAHILAVAEKLFAQKGLHETSVADIAKEAEFGVGTLYKYFTDKNTLIESLVNNRMNEQFSILEAVLADDAPSPVLIDRLIEAYFISIETRRDFFKMHFTSFHPGTGQISASSALDMSGIFEKKLTLFDQMKAVFEKGIAQGDFAHIDPHYLASALYGMLISFYFLSEFRMDGQFDIPKMKQAITTILFQPILIDKKIGEVA